MDDSLKDNENHFQKPRRVIERSAAYPAISIEEAIQFVLKVFKNFPGIQSITREDIAAVLPDIPAIHRPIAASVHYGLITRDKNKYQISQLFKDLCNPISESEKRRLLMEVFQSPTLYSDLISKHDGHVIPVELKTHLIRFHRIVEKVALEVAEGFINNAKFVGAVTENNILRVKDAMPNEEISLPTENLGSIEKNTETQKDIVESPIISDFAKTKEPLLLNEMNNEERVKIRLTQNRFAYLIFPNNLTSRDIQILKKEIEQLELIVE